MFHHHCCDRGCFSIVGDVNVGITVVVVIADGHAHTVVGVAGVCQAGLLRDIRERAVFILAIETIPVGGVVAIKTVRTKHGVTHKTTVHDKDVHQAVIVVIEEGDTAGHGLNEIFPRRGRVAQDEIDAGHEAHAEHSVRIGLCLLREHGKRAEQGKQTRLGLKRSRQSKILSLRDGRGTAQRLYVQRESQSNFAFSQFELRISRSLP